jgi:predicted MPP superfamily phosphohydrolase
LIPDKDFSNHKHFPGTHGNPFDVILHKLEDFDQLSDFLFLLLLGGISTLGTSLFLVRGMFSQSIALFMLILLDWLLIALLPRKGRSFGPVKPAVLLLSFGRAFFALAPLSLCFFLLLQILGTAAVIYGFWIEPFRLKVTRLELATRKFAPGASVRILHIGDLHMERHTIRETRLLQAVQELRPDLILFSGDILNLSYLHDPVSWQAARSIFRQLSAPLGVYLVSGSPAVDLEEIMPELLQDLPVRWLKDEVVSIPIGGASLALVGTTCTHRPFIDGPRLGEVAANLNSSTTFRILLHHSPDLAPIAAGMGFDIQLSGHTHGGQVCLPFYGALFTASLYGKRFEAGSYQLDSMLLYITRGIGMEGCGGPRVRFLCPPEITLWEISSEN